jgi:hypothetical protein
MTAKMHELLAAESSVSTVYNTMHEETMSVLGKPDHFTRATTTKTFFNDEDSKLNTQETKDNVTTVADRLKYFFNNAFVRYFDLLAAKDKTNQVAQADLVLKGETIAQNVPATLLLTLENRLNNLRSMLLSAPTLRPGPEWQWDETERMFKTKEPQVSFATKKTIRPIILHPATDKHPAQVDKISEDIPVAKVEKLEWSGNLTSGEKSDMLGRLDELVLAIKEARQRANNAEVVQERIGQKFADYIIGPINKSAAA